MTHRIRLTRRHKRRSVRGVKQGHGGHTRERGQFHFEAVAQRKQANVEADGGQEKNEEKGIRLITITSVCGVTATASVRRSVWMMRV